MLSASPAVCGRSPLVDTTVPSLEWVPLKNLFCGLSASETAVPLSSIWLDPLEWPKKAATPTFAS
jgi:hypothetical protein